MKSIHYFIVGIIIFSGINSTAQTECLAESSIAGILEDELPVVATRYYYYPNLDAYYDTRTNLYIYMQDGQWVKGKEIVNGYRDYSVYNKVRVEITDYDGEAPQTKLEEHRQKFPKQYSAKRKPPKTSGSESKIALN